jgi:hypothetical protein
VQIKLTNYRCFPNGAVLDLSNGFTALVGVNNSGKSSLLRFAYELHPLLLALRQTTALLTTLKTPHTFQAQVADPDELFSKGSDANLIFEIVLQRSECVSSYPGVEAPNRLIVNVEKRSRTWRSQLAFETQLLDPPDDGRIIPRRSRRHLSETTVNG